MVERPTDEELHANEFEPEPMDACGRCASQCSQHREEVQCHGACEEALAQTTKMRCSLGSISSDDIKGQAPAAAALIAANVTPVVAVRIPFGGDNHSDNNLQAETDQHVSGCAGIQQVLSALGSNGLALTDKVTFATWNVFGRNLDGLPKVTQQQGRDHYGNHCVGVMIGKNIAPGVVGGVALQGSALVAADIASSTGAAAAGGDIPAVDTHVAYARTLGVALGIPSIQVNADLISAAGGKVVNAALSNVAA